MRVLHIVAVVAADGGYGGPTRVAVNQARELARLGNEVTLIATEEGLGPGSRSFERVPVTLFRRRRIPRVGYAGTWSIALWWWVIRNIGTFDAVHIHMSRDLVTLPSAVVALIGRTDFVVQCHGMVVPKRSAAVRLFDRFVTARLLSTATRVLCLNDEEVRRVRQLSPDAKAMVVPNGVPDTSIVRNLTVVPDKPEVLFLARLHRRKRPELFAQAAAVLLNDEVSARFRVVGPDEGAGAEVDSVVEEFVANGGDATDLAREPAVAAAEVLDRLAVADVYVLPAEDEPFGMSVVEACSTGVPVIVMRDCGLAAFVERNRCGLVVDDATPAALADAIRALLDDPRAAEEMGRRGREGVSREFSMAAIGRQLGECYSVASLSG